MFRNIFMFSFLNSSLSRNSFVQSWSSRKRLNCYLFPPVCLVTRRKLYRSRHLCTSLFKVRVYVLRFKNLTLTNLSIIIPKYLEVNFSDFTYTSVTPLCLCFHNWTCCIKIIINSEHNIYQTNSCAYLCYV